MLARHLDSWFEANPFHRGINWASALEVAFRALSWVWILHLAGERLPARCRARLFDGLYKHARHLAHNLSVYFAPNTHLLGEAVCLHALGRMFPQLPEATQWRRLGAEWVQRSLDTQVLPDGAYFEQSSFYHLYAIDFFLFHAALNNVSAAYLDRLRRMCTVLQALTDLDGSFPLLGDDDGGRFFHPFGDRRQFPRATLTTASFFLNQSRWRFGPEDYAEAGLWLLGNQPARSFDSAEGRARETGVFHESGLLSGGDSRHHIVFSAKAFGTGSAGHSHAHALHFILRSGQQDLLVDSGTFTYVGDQNLRNRFRNTAAHNTLRVDSIDQGTPVNPFRWGAERWEGRFTEASSVPGSLALIAIATSPDGVFRLTRSLRWSTGQALVCDDTVEGPSGEHLIEQFWHVPPDAVWESASGQLRWASGARMRVPRGTQAAFGPSEISGALCHRAPACTLRLTLRATLPARLHTSIE